MALKKYIYLEMSQVDISFMSHKSKAAFLILCPASYLSGAGEHSNQNESGHDLEISGT